MMVLHLDAAVVEAMTEIAWRAKTMRIHSGIMFG